MAMMNPAAAAGGAMPQQGIPQQGMPQQPVTAVAQGNTMTTQITEILNALKQVLPQVVNQQGYVDMDRLVMMWSQVSQVPFQVVVQLIQQNPEILIELITQFGLAGIISQGKIIAADELAALGGGR